MLLTSAYATQLNHLALKCPGSLEMKDAQYSDSRRSLSELVSELQCSAEEVASVAKSSESDREVFSEFAVSVDKFLPILADIKDNEVIMDRPPVRKAVESLEKELNQTKVLIKAHDSGSPTKQIVDVSQDLGRSLGLLLFASIDMSSEIKERIGALQKELMSAKFDSSFAPSPGYSVNISSQPSRESGFVSEIESEKETEEGRIIPSVDDVVLQLKYGNDEELCLALSGLCGLICDARDQVVDKKWMVDEAVIPILFNRLSSAVPSNRLSIIQILRIIASDNPEHKEKMVDVGYLSVLVKSLAQDVLERREAVGLLLDLSDIASVRRRIGKIQGCIVMLVTIFNGDDKTASLDAGRLIMALSNNTQNALHMAEAGYFKPLVHCLKEGSDMSKILMATAVSRMELTDQCRASLGEEGAVEPLVKMYKSGNLEAKLSALNALQNLSNLTENIQRLISSGIIVPLLQLLFSVTSVLMTLREPASAILAKIAQAGTVLVKQDVAQQILSLLNLSSPLIQYHLLQALNSIASHSSASKVRRKLKKTGALQLLAPFLTEPNIKIRTAALNLIHTLSRDSPEELMEQLGESNLNHIIGIVSSSIPDTEKVAAVGILCSLPPGNRKATHILKNSCLLPILISTLSATTSSSTLPTSQLVENVMELLIRFTAPSDKKLQLLSAELGLIPLLVKSLSVGSILVKCRAATSLAQLSQNTIALRKSRKSSWLCMPPSAESFCKVHNGYCNIKTTFCLIKAGAVSPLIQILQAGEEREADEAVLNSLATLVQDQIWESGSNYLAEMSGVEAIVRVLETGNVKAQSKALWILERLFRIQEHRANHGESAQVVLIDLAQNGDQRLKPTIAQVLAHLDLLQAQSSYF
ncbi:hypothetical protein K2173_024965 [Erythroxylum novogranatense]|uniref:Uncharacterized protein n=1 Tax=Erythroxylum novogranatense TaxID=1862640 RepID=A0AAV8UCM2_9ROSI|nr:hypothetical protein K2173_024965 [Erythroxylum novogranatense]